MKKIFLTLIICFCFIACNGQKPYIQEQNKVIEQKKQDNFELVMHPDNSYLYVYKTIVKDVNGNDKTVIISYTKGHGGIHSTSSVHTIVLENN